MKRTIGDLFNSIDIIAEFLELESDEVDRILELGFNHWADINKFGAVQRAKAEEIFLILDKYKQ